MISTPNQGSVLANLSGKPGSDNCTLAETANLQDLHPTSPFLQELNQQPWPAGTAVHSIVSNNAGFDSDDVVTVTSQDLTELPQYRSSVTRGDGCKPSSATASCICAYITNPRLSR